MGDYDPEAELMSDRRDFRTEMTAARLEISRLQAEVERLSNELEASERGSLGRKLQRDIAQVQRDRSWNDAIIAAAALVVPWEHPVGVANKILSLKRT